jgi:hypothetical protein
MRIMRFCTLIVLFTILGSLVAACNRDGQDNAVKTVDPNEQPKISPYHSQIYSQYTNPTEEFSYDRGNSRPNARYDIRCKR